MLKVYPNEDNKVTLRCPNCSKVKNIDVSPFLKKEGAAKLKYRFKCSHCDCGHKDCAECKDKSCANDNTNIVMIERRKFFRKKVNLPGVLQDKEGRRHPIRLLDLSRTGVRTKIITNHTLQLGQKLQLEFNLDDAKETAIKKLLVVRKIEAKVVDGEFIETDSFDKNDKAIGFYLM